MLLEGFAAGVPAVCTDVGACRRLIFGGEHDDLGAAGDIIGIADPQGLAHAATALLTDTTRWRAAQATAIARVETHYTDVHMYQRYRTLYQEAQDA
ncbi:GT4 family glycosyltransferase PelF [Acidiferrobacter sp. SPIII_3]|uniref:GT4 family glycosyltransferase PelF n=1 Tax=Acidiferrobacter sp. SPIII_3 TaxID=1281578 RepID=UPI00197AEA69|nr:GT4 family glycosyltransferase PelF [Acidiferrobacter sp. SPIII_3]